MKNNVKVSCLKISNIDKNILLKDVRNAEKYFDRSGETAKAAYKDLEEELKETKKVTETAYLYFPGTAKDIYDLYLN